METKIEKCSLSIITRLPQICKPNEFMVAFFIINTMSIEKKDRITMYRGELADLCNMSERNISRLTDSLNNIGVIQEELIGDAEKKKTIEQLDDPENTKAALRTEISEKKTAVGELESQKEAKEAGIKAGIKEGIKEGKKEFY